MGYGSVSLFKKYLWFCTGLLASTAALIVDMKVARARTLWWVTGKRWVGPAAVNPKIWVHLPREKVRSLHHISDHAQSQGYFCYKNLPVLFLSNWFHYRILYIDRAHALLRLQLKISTVHCGGLIVNGRIYMYDTSSQYLLRLQLVNGQKYSYSRNLLQGQKKGQGPCTLLNHRHWLMECHHFGWFVHWVRWG